MLVCFVNISRSVQGGEPIAIRNLSKGVFSGIAEAQTKVIRDATKWEQMWKQHSANGTTQPLPVVDFKKEMILIATLGTKNSGGYSIEIVGVEGSSKELQVRVVSKSPPKGSMSLQALTAPFHFVAIPASSAAVKFEQIEAQPAQPKK